jgi:hypothetical protein
MTIEKYPVGRGYPNTAAWGPNSASNINWMFHGGDYPSLNRRLATQSNPGVVSSGAFLFYGGVKGTGIPGALYAQFGHRMPEEIMLVGAVPGNRRAKASFGKNHQYSYMSDTFAHYSETGKDGAFLFQMQSWRSRGKFGIVRKMSFSLLFVCSDCDAGFSSFLFLFFFFG